MQNTVEWRQELCSVSLWSFCLYLVTEFVVLRYEAKNFLYPGCLWEWGNISVPGRQLCVTRAAAMFLESSCWSQAKNLRNNSENQLISIWASVEFCFSYSPYQQGTNSCCSALSLALSPASAVLSHSYAAGGISWRQSRQQYSTASSSNWKI